MQPRCPGDAYFRPFSSGIACRFISLLTAAGSVKVPSQTSDVIADGMTRDKSRNMVQNHECLPRRRRNAGQVQPAPWDGSTETLDSSFRWLPQFLQTKRMVSILPVGPHSCAYSAVGMGQDTRKQTSLQSRVSSTQSYAARTHAFIAQKGTTALHPDLCIS